MAIIINLINNNNSIGYEHYKKYVLLGHRLLQMLIFTPNSQPEHKTKLHNIHNDDPRLYRIGNKTATIPIASDLNLQLQH